MANHVPAPDLSALTESLHAIVQGEVSRQLDGKEPESGKPKTLDQRVRQLKAIWDNNGVDPMGRTDERLTWEALCKMAKDSAASPDIQLMIPKVISEFVREPLDWNMVLTGLLQRMSFQNGQQIVFPAVGAMGGVNLDMAEGEEYPELSVDMAGTVVARIGKVGIAVRFTEELLRYSMFDVMALHLRAAGRALARWKETKVANMILAEGDISFDNASASYSNTSGRDSGGAANGGITIDDLLVMYADLVNEGFVPNALLMNPMGWLIFARDPTMRAFGFMNGGPLFQTYQGQISYANEFKQGPWGPLAGRSAGLGSENIATTYTNVPRLFPYPLQIIVSPVIPFDSTNLTTDIIMCDTNELGILIEDEPPTTDQWRDPTVDIEKVKIRERYAIGLLNQGRAVRTAKNVKITRSYDLDDALTWQAGSGALPDPGTSPIV